MIEETKKFLLLTVPKSGSNYLGAQLSELSDVIFLNTLFSKGFFATHFNMHNLGLDAKTGVLTEFVKLILSDEKVVEELARVRTERPEDWFMSIMQMNPGGYLGVKLHPYVDSWYFEKNKETGKNEIKATFKLEAIVDFFAAINKFKLITMSRKNFHEQLASSLISMKAEYFSVGDQNEAPHLFKDGTISNKDIDRYKPILAVYKKCYQYIEKIHTNDNVIHIWYEDLIIGNIPKKLLKQQ